MASSKDADYDSCVNDPNFAIICSFFDKFSTLCGIKKPSFADLQEMINSTENVSPDLIDLHVRLIRKAKKNCSHDRWERTLAKFCYSYCPNESWELEQKGYKQLHFSQKLKLLLGILEAQFDFNVKFKVDVNKLEVGELRLNPLGKDKDGNSYWLHVDQNLDLKIYKENLDQETWTIIAKDRGSLVSVIENLINDRDPNWKHIEEKDNSDEETDEESLSSGVCIKEEEKNIETENITTTIVEQNENNEEKNLTQQESKIETEQKKCSTNEICSNNRSDRTESLIKDNSVENIIKTNENLEISKKNEQKSLENIDKPYEKNEQVNTSDSSLVKIRNNLSVGNNLNLQIKNDKNSESKSKIDVSHSVNRKGMNKESFALHLEKLNSENMLLPLLNDNKESESSNSSITSKISMKILKSKLEEQSNLKLGLKTDELFSKVSSVSKFEDNSKNTFNNSISPYSNSSKINKSGQKLEQILKSKLAQKLAANNSSTALKEDSDRCVDVNNKLFNETKNVILESKNIDSTCIPSVTSNDKSTTQTKESLTIPSINKNYNDESPVCMKKIDSIEKISDCMLKKQNSYSDNLTSDSKFTENTLNSSGKRKLVNKIDENLSIKKTKFEDSEEIEEPVMIVTGVGSGAECNVGNNEGIEPSSINSSNKPGNSATSHFTHKVDDILKNTTTENSSEKSGEKASEDVEKKKLKLWTIDTICSTSSSKDVSKVQSDVCLFPNYNFKDDKSLYYQSSLNPYNFINAPIDKLKDKTSEECLNIPAPNFYFGCDSRKSCFVPYTKSEMFEKPCESEEAFNLCVREKKIPEDDKLKPKSLVSFSCTNTINLSSTSVSLTSNKDGFSKGDPCINTQITTNNNSIVVDNNTLNLCMNTENQISNYNNSSTKEFGNIYESRLKNLEEKSCLTKTDIASESVDFKIERKARNDENICVQADIENIKQVSKPDKTKKPYVDESIKFISNKNQEICTKESIVIQKNILNQRTESEITSDLQIVKHEKNVENTDIKKLFNEIDTPAKNEVENESSLEKIDEMNQEDNIEKNNAQNKLQVIDDNPQQSQDISLEKNNASNELLSTRMEHKIQQSEIIFEKVTVQNKLSSKKKGDYKLHQLLKSTTEENEVQDKSSNRNEEQQPKITMESEVESTTDLRPADDKFLQSQKDFGDCNVNTESDVQKVEDTLQYENNENISIIPQSEKFDDINISEEDSKSQKDSEELSGTVNKLNIEIDPDKTTHKTNEQFSIAVAEVTSSLDEKPVSFHETMSDLEKSSSNSVTINENRLEEKLNDIDTSSEISNKKVSSSMNSTCEVNSIEKSEKYSPKTEHQIENNNIENESGTMKSENEKIKIEEGTANCDFHISDTENTDFSEPNLLEKENSVKDEIKRDEVVLAESQGISNISETLQKKSDENQESSINSTLEIDNSDAEINISLQDNNKELSQESKSLKKENKKKKKDVELPAYVSPAVRTSKRLTVLKLKNDTINLKITKKKGTAENKNKKQILLNKNVKEKVAVSGKKRKSKLSSENLETEDNNSDTKLKKSKNKTQKLIENKNIGDPRILTIKKLKLKNKTLNDEKKKTKILYKKKGKNKVKKLTVKSNNNEAETLPSLKASKCKNSLLKNQKEIKYQAKDTHISKMESKKKKIDLKWQKSTKIKVDQPYFDNNDNDFNNEEDVEDDLNKTEMKVENKIQNSSATICEPQGIGKENDQETDNNENNAETPKIKKPRKRSAKKSWLDNIDTSNIEPFNPETCIRQSRRIAQLKIKEQAEGKYTDQVSSPKKLSTPQKSKVVLTPKKTTKISAKKSKFKTIKNDSEDEMFYKKSSSVKKRKKNSKKNLNSSHSWKPSSGSSSEEEADEDHFEEEEEEEEELVINDASDHEFSPESDINDDDYEPVKRARTAHLKSKSDDKQAKDDLCCQKCSAADQPEWILLCDRCDEGWHASCLTPPLMSIPEGDWFCPPCQHNMLISSFQKFLRTYDKNVKKRTNEELQKKRLEYVGISTSNILSEKGVAISYEPRIRKEDFEKYSSSEDTEEESEDEPLYQLRIRRQVNVSHRLNQYDEIMNSAIEREAIEAPLQENLNIEAVNTNSQPEHNSDVVENVQINTEPMEELKNVESVESDGEKRLSPVLQLKGIKKKTARLTQLDISSEDDHFSDEDFKGSSNEDGEDDDEYGKSETDSDELHYRKSLREPVRRSTRARVTRYDNDFINDNSEDDYKTSKKKRYFKHSDTDSEEEDSTWGKRKSYPRKPKSKKKKRRRIVFDDESDEDKIRKTKKSRVKYGLDESEDDYPLRRTRGKRINYVETLKSESEDENLDTKRQHKKFVSDDEDYQDEGDEGSDKITYENKEPEKKDALINETANEIAEVPKVSSDNPLQEPAASLNADLMKAHDTNVEQSEKCNTNLNIVNETKKISKKLPKKDRLTYPGKVKSNNSPNLEKVNSNQSSSNQSSESLPTFVKNPTESYTRYPGESIPSSFNIDNVSRANIITTNVPPTTILDIDKQIAMPLRVVSPSKLYAQDGQQHLNLNGMPSSLVSQHATSVIQSPNSTSSNFSAIRRPMPPSIPISSVIQSRPNMPMQYINSLNAPRCPTSVPRMSSSLSCNPVIESPKRRSRGKSKKQLKIEQEMQQESLELNINNSEMMPLHMLKLSPAELNAIRQTRPNVSNSSMVPNIDNFSHKMPYPPSASQQPNQSSVTIAGGNSSKRIKITPTRMRMPNAPNMMHFPRSLPAPNTAVLHSSHHPLDPSPSGGNTVTLTNENEKSISSSLTEGGENQTNKEQRYYQPLYSQSSQVQRNYNQKPEYSTTIRKSSPSVYQHPQLSGTSTIAPSATVINKSLSANTFSTSSKISVIQSGPVSSPVAMKAENIISTASSHSSNLYPPQYSGGSVVSQPRIPTSVSSSTSHPAVTSNQTDVVSNEGYLIPLKPASQTATTNTVIETNNPPTSDYQLLHVKQTSSINTCHSFTQPVSYSAPYYSSTVVSSSYSQSPLSHLSSVSVPPSIPLPNQPARKLSPSPIPFKSESIAETESASISSASYMTETNVSRNSNYQYHELKTANSFNNSFNQPISNEMEKPSGEIASSGEFGGLVSYFSSQREEELDD